MTKTPVAAIAACASLLAVACGPTDVEQDVEVGLDDAAPIYVPPTKLVTEATWGGDFTCWLNDQHICNRSTMLLDWCDNRNPGPGVCNRADPYEMVGRLSNGCTGTLIGNKYVLTAAHCVVNNDNTLSASSVTFSLSQFASCPGGCPHGSVAVKKAYVPKIYSNLVTSGLERRKATDVAMLELDITVPNGPTPFPPPAYVDYVDIWNANLYSLGYPGDKPTGSQWNVVGEYKTMSAFPPGVHVIKTDIDGVGGQSGSPVYILDNGDRRLVGVLIGSPVSDCELGYTWVTKLTDWVLDNVVYAPIFQGWGADLSHLDILTYPTRNTLAPNSICD